MAQGIYSGMKNSLLISVEKNVNISKLSDGECGDDIHIQV